MDNGMLSRLMAVPRERIDINDPRVLAVARRMGKNGQQFNKTDLGVELSTNPPTQEEINEAMAYIAAQQQPAAKPQVGAQPSPEMLQRIQMNKAKQNEEFLRRKMLERQRFNQYGNERPPVHSRDMYGE